MFKILLVEDNPDTLNQLSELLKEEIPDAFVDTAETVQKALGWIDTAKESRTIYHVAILDFKLPQFHGDMDEVDEKICLRIRFAMKDSLVAHITAHPRDERIDEHIEKFHKNDVSHTAFVLSKTDNEWSTILLSKIKSFLYSWMIEDQIEEIDSRLDYSGYSPRRRTRMSQNVKQGSLTHALGALQGNIIKHWKYLGVGLQERIKEIFKVEVNDGDLLSIHLVASQEDKDEPK